MSSDNSQGSASTPSRAQAPNRQDRYSRAQDRAARETATPLEQQRSEAKARQVAATRQASMDRAEAARLQAERASRKGAVDDVVALLDGSADSSPGGREPRDPGEARKDAPPKRAAGDDAPSQSSPADELDDEDDEDGESRPKSKSVKLADFAAENELDVDELYALTVQTDDGESYTLGQLKDGAKQVRELDSREADFDEQRELHYNEIALKNQNIEALLNRLKAYVPADVLAKAAVEAEGDPEETRQRSIRQLREWFPEWKDNQHQQRDRERVETRLTAYGFSKFEVAAISDARIIRFLVESARKLDRYDRLRAMPRDKIPTTQEPSKKAKPSRTTSTDDRAQALAKKGDAVGAVATLLGG